MPKSGQLRHIEVENKLVYFLQKNTYNNFILFEMPPRVDI